MKETRKCKKKNLFFLFLFILIEVKLNSIIRYKSCHIEAASKKKSLLFILHSYDIPFINIEEKRKLHKYRRSYHVNLYKTACHTMWRKRFYKCNVHYCSYHWQAITKSWKRIIDGIWKYYFELLFLSDLNQDLRYLKGLLDYLFLMQITVMLFWIFKRAILSTTCKILYSVEHD